MNSLFDSCCQLIVLLALKIIMVKFALVELLLCLTSLCWLDAHATCVDEDCRFPVIAICKSHRCQNGICSPDANTRNGYKCICNPGYQGEFCDDDLNECVDKGICNDGICTNINILEEPFGNGFVCQCPEYRLGSRCEIFVDACKKKGSDVFCLNDGSCMNNTCSCKDGFAGSRCERAVPFLYELKAQGCPFSDNLLRRLQSTFADGICDVHFNMRECFFDGFDCTKALSDSNDTRLSECRERNKCVRSFGDGKCESVCNVTECGYDGGDCDIDERAKQNSSTKVAAFNISQSSPSLPSPSSHVLALTFLENPDVVTMNMRLLLYDIATRLHIGTVSVSRDRSGHPQVYQWIPTNENGSESGAIAWKAGNRIPEDFMIAPEFYNSSDGTLVFLRLDFSKCKEGYYSPSNCIADIDSAYLLLARELLAGRGKAVIDGLLHTTNIWIVYDVADYGRVFVMLIVLLTILVILCMLSLIISCYLHKIRASMGGLKMKSKSVLTINYESLSRGKCDIAETDCVFRSPHSFTQPLITSSPPKSPASEFVRAVTCRDKSYASHLLKSMTKNILPSKADDGIPLLHIAVFNNDPDMLRFLLVDCDLNVFERDSNGRSAIVFAAFVGHHQLDCYQILIDHIKERRIYLEDVDNNGNLCNTRRNTILPLSGEGILSYSLTDNEGRNAVHHAAVNNLPHLIHTFIFHGANKDLYDKNRETPLHLAAQYGSSLAVEALLQCNANIRGINANDRSAADVAEMFGNDTICSMISNFTRFDESGIGSMSHASYYSNEIGITPLRHGPPPQIKVRQGFNSYKSPRRLSGVHLHMPSLSPSSVALSTTISDTDYGSISRRDDILTPPSVLLLSCDDSGTSTLPHEHGGHKSISKRDSLRRHSCMLSLGNSSKSSKDIQALSTCNLRSFQSPIPMTEFSI